MDVVFGLTKPFQYQDDFPGFPNYPLEPEISFTYEFWVDGTVLQIQGI